jgi:uncharacterized membrane protein
MLLLYPKESSSAYVIIVAGLCLTIFSFCFGLSLESFLYALLGISIVLGGYFIKKGKEEDL